jgi:hypothetical protein
MPEVRSFVVSSTTLEGFAEAVIARADIETSFGTVFSLVRLNPGVHGLDRLFLHHRGGHFLAGIGRSVVNAPVPGPDLGCWFLDRINPGLDCPIVVSNTDPLIDRLCGDPARQEEAFHLLFANLPDIVPGLVSDRGPSVTITLPSRTGTSPKVPAQVLRGCSRGRAVDPPQTHVDAINRATRRIVRALDAAGMRRRSTIAPYSPWLVTTHVESCWRTAMLPLPLSAIERSDARRRLRAIGCGDLLDHPAD